MLYWLIKIFLAPFTRLFWIKKVEGRENIPTKGAYIIAANHASYFDFLSLVVIWPRHIYFLAAEKFWKSKFWHPIVSGTGQIEVDRQSKQKEAVYKKVFATLRRKDVLGIFPEGTRSADGKIGKTFTGVAKFALKAKVKVVPVGIKGAYEVLPRQNKWPKFKKIISIKIGKPMDFKDYYGMQEDPAVLRKITNQIMDQVAELSGQ